MREAMDLQSMMLALQHFWAEHGCLIWQPYHTEVGAGTMNPGTFLRVLGPEPWNVAYVEPSIRPDDGRFGENPNRMQQHYQFQVILKPDPGNPQELYLQSLEALGIDLQKHDLRFVEDNWRSPALGAWGLGWQVWLDGQEITQFTYFQQAGGINLDPVAVELTYGMERIAMPLQGVNHFRDIRWSPTLTYGDVNLEAEAEHSRYFFEVADVDRLRQLFDDYEVESGRALAQDLILPAYDYVLKCSHTFNVLDTRGAVGVTERQAYFGRMRELARRVSEAYLAQRQRMEYPWLDGDGAAAPASAAGAPAAGRAEAPAGAGAAAEGPADFLLEVGTEELPPGDLRDALAQLDAAVPAMLAELRLEHGPVRVLGTPRRLVVHVASLAARQSDREELVKGPPADRAFDADGNPTRAALGFARSKGVEVDELEARDLDGGRYLVAVVREPGQTASAVLAGRLQELIGGLRFNMSMRWNATNVAFSRPVRWLLALHGEEVVPLAFAGVQAGRTTRGLRDVSPSEFSVSSPGEYFDRLEGQGIVLDVDERQERILEGLQALADEVGGQPGRDPGLLADVANEVEAPAVVRGSFDPEFLALPREVLIAVMKKHQNYFPLEKAGKLMPYFATACNGSHKDLTLVAAGNEDVIRARFADGAFFVAEDRKKPLADYVPVLDTLTFQQELGSMGAKVARIEKITAGLADRLSLSEAEAGTAIRAAQLSKADLVTRMVVEMTSLQGVMGRYYALDSGETEAVARAIEEHYQPRHAGDSPPEGRPGLVVGLADRLDTLVGLFAAGLEPTGAKDPFAQRRAALGLVGNLIVRDLDFDLAAAVDLAAEVQPIPVSAEHRARCLGFIVERLRNQLLEEGYAFDVVDAVLGAQGANPAGAARAVQALRTWVGREDWQAILPAYARCVRITRDLDEDLSLAPDQLSEGAARGLYAALQTAEAVDRAPGSVDDFLEAFVPMIPAIERFFEDVLVMDEDPAVRDNRLALLQRVAALADGVADLSRLEGF